ncbi:hypothetical protein ACI2VK_08020 [Ralstonia nicotianae]|uniref:hypothetical protein n=1 Tax=Ralstonia pseudosolanacearum TaxID=1310165 RepID=UPI000CE560C7|nr:hypothetical protein [Ralstonia pseudosolanacearum]MBX9432003.1 hypothetical protein [Ralstonia pseudosolanacearum]MCF1441358.1 hypothetical protein [Ralstonia solanacearum]
MDYFKAAFGGFAPHKDEDAAVKFALNAVLMDDRLQELAEFVVDGSQFGGIKGEPGWILERRELADEGNEEAYPGWPAGARFKASVDEDAYRLQHAEYFMSRETFMKYLVQAVDAYVAAEPARSRAPSVVALRNVIA